MKKTWNFGLALAFGLSSLPAATFAQYASTPYGSGSLAPSGYAVNDPYAQSRMGYAQPSMQPMQAMQQTQSMQPMQTMAQPVTYGMNPGFAPNMQGVAQLPQYTQYAQGPVANVVAFPQEPVPAPSINANQPVERGWIGPNNAQYTPTPDAASMQGGTMPAPMNSVPMNNVPMNPAPMHAGQMHAGPMQAGPVYSDSGCAGGCGGGYNASPGYGAMLAPAATAPMYGGGACGGPGYGAPVYGGPVYASPIIPSGFGRGAAGFLGNRGGVPGKAFFAGGSALLMTRVDDHNVALTYNTAMPSENVLGTRDARQYDLNGFEVFIGRYFNCGRNALVLNYWGLFPEDRTAQIDAPAAPSAYRSRYHFNGIEMPTQTVYDWYDGARSHRITRGSSFHNIEANLLGFAVGGAARTWAPIGPRRGAFGVGGYGGGFAGGHGGGFDTCGTGGCGGGCGDGSCGDAGDCGSYADCGSCGSGCASFTGPCGLTPNMCGSRLNWTWLGGFRFFRFEDDLQYAASDTDTVYNATDDLYYDVNVRNDLAGFQLGGAGTYCLGRRFNVYALTKGGVYNNHSEFSTRIYRTGGPTATINSANVFNGQSFMVNSSKNQAAFLGEFGTGVGARISRGWSANVGYRVIGAAGVATAVNNIPIEMLHLGNVADFNNTSSLLLHGWTLGGMYNF